MMPNNITKKNASNCNFFHKSQQSSVSLCFLSSFLYFLQASTRTNFILIYVLPLCRLVSLCRQRDAWASAMRDRGLFVSLQRAANYNVWPSTLKSRAPPILRSAQMQVCAPASERGSGRRREEGRNELDCRMLKAEQMFANNSMFLHLKQKRAQPVRRRLTIVTWPWWTTAGRWCSGRASSN